MSEEFIRKLAQAKAAELFRPECFERLSDVWYYKEMFEKMRAQAEEECPEQGQASVYMDELSKQFYKMQDKYFGNISAMDSYRYFANEFFKLMNEMEEHTARYQCFEIDEQIVQALQLLSGYFYRKYQQLSTDGRA